MTKDYKIYINDILEAIESIERFVGHMDFEEFQVDDKTKNAVIRKLEVIGEATKRVPDTIRRQYADIPWQKMAGMRDRLIHFYMDIDDGIVWDTVKNKLPLLKAGLKKIVF